MDKVLFVAAFKGFLVGVCLSLLVAAVFARKELEDRRANLHLAMAIIAVLSSSAGLLLAIIY